MAKKIKRIKFNIERFIDFLLYLWIFLLPLQTRLIYLLPNESKLRVRTFLPGRFWEYGVIDFYATESLVLFILFLILYNIFRTKQYYNLGKKLLKRIDFNISLVWIIILILVYLFLSLFWSEDQLLTSVKIIHLSFVLLGVGLVLYRKLDWNRIVLVFIASGLVQGMMAINQFLSQKILPNKYLGIAKQFPHIFGVSVILSGSERWLRAYGSLFHPNALGGFLVYVFIFLVFFIFKVETRYKTDFQNEKDGKTKFFLLGLYGSVFFVFSGLLLSFSRAAWLAVLFVCLFYFLFVFFKVKTKKAQSTLKKIFLVILVTILFWFSLAPKPFITRIKGQEVLERYSNIERIDSLYDSRIIIKDYFWQGVGFGVYPEVLATKYPREQFFSNHPVHNVWLLILAETGVFGLLLFCLLIIYVLKRTENKQLAYLVIFSLLISTMFDHWWISSYFGIYLLAILFLILVNIKEKRLI